MPTQCKSCKGAGLVHREKSFQCQYCSNNFCYKCEGLPFKGKYKECTQCHGSGTIYSKATATGKK